MSNAVRKRVTLAIAGCAILFGTQGWADDTTDAPRFAAPKRIMAGDKFLGEGRYYPSPVMHDIDGDKRPDLVIGDLMGRVTFAPGTAHAAFGAEVKLKNRSGDDLKFSNW